MKSDISFVEERHEHYTVTTAVLGNFGTKALFADEQRLHIPSWQGWAGAHLGRLERMQLSVRQITRLAETACTVGKMLGDTQLDFQLGWCTAYHGQELVLAYRVCKVPAKGPCRMHTLTHVNGCQVYIRREYTLGVW